MQYFEDKLAGAIEKLAEFYKADIKPLITLSDPEGRNFRKTVWPDYKANRKTKRSPLKQPRPAFSTKACAARS